MKLLLAFPARRSAGLGASQLALHLGAGLRSLGHEIVEWEPPAGEPVPSLQAALVSFAAAKGPFDAVDVPPPFATRALRRHGAIVIRSIQPELQYLRAERSLAGARPRWLRVPVDALGRRRRRRQVMRGWELADRIVCLGAHELSWMRSRFPRWSNKLGSYRACPSDEDRAGLLRLRRQRSAAPRPVRRLLWIGRWTAHKGTENLLRLAGEIEVPGGITVAGTGPLPYDPRIETLRLQERLNIVEHFGRGELEGLLASHDAGLFTSIAEGWGLSIQEMLESGMPVFATPVGAVTELAPFFADALRPFPPTASDLAALPRATSVLPPGYAERFNWRTIAAEYAASIGGVVSPAAPTRGAA